VKKEFFRRDEGDEQNNGFALDPLCLVEWDYWSEY